MNKLTMKMRLFAAFLLLGLWGATAQTAREQIAAMPERAGGIYHSYEYRPAAALRARRVHAVLHQPLWPPRQPLAYFGKDLC
ncbi:MAG: hypothetical protein ACLRM8_06500 [Alistipes sp.]